MKEEKNRSGFVRGLVVGIVIVVVVVLVVSLIARWRAASVETTWQEEELLDAETEEKIVMISDYIGSRYYEEVPIEDLREGLYQGLFDNLDVYSRYYTAEEYDEMLSSQIEGTFYGIGVLMQQDPETMVVTLRHVYEGSPAEEAGIMVGDILYAVDGQETATMEISEIADLIRGAEGTTVHLVIYRNGTEMEFDVERRDVDYQTALGEMVEDDIGLITVSEFASNTVDQFERALNELSEEGMDALIIDLRYNTGGVLDSACDMLNDLLPEGLLVYTEDREGQRIEYRSDDERMVDVPLVVLVNEFSASASEIFAGAIQDRDAGTIIGTTTYGKGVVQSVFPLSDGSAFKMTTQTYYTPNGTCIEGVGITPDIELPYEYLGTEDETYDYAHDNQVQEAERVLEEEIE